MFFSNNKKNNKLKLNGDRNTTIACTYNMWYGMMQYLRFYYSLEKPCIRIQIKKSRDKHVDRKSVFGTERQGTNER